MTLTPQRISAPAKGWNTVTPLREMSHDFAVKLENVWFDQTQAMNRRPGQQPLSTTAVSGTAQIKHSFEHRSITGSSKLFFWTDDGKISEWTSPTWTVRDSSFSSRVRSAMMGNILVVGDGVNPAKKYNGSAWSAITTPPSPVGSDYIGNIFHTHQGRMYAAGDPSQRLTVYYSASVAASGADYWSQTLSGSDKGGFIDVSGALGEGDEVTGLTSYLGMLVVLCKNNIVFYNNADPEDASFGVHKVIRGIGCFSHDSIQGIGNDTIFLSKYGFKTLQQVLVQGDAATLDKSVPINNYVVEELLSGNTLDTDIRSTFIEKLGVYLCSFNGFTLVYHVLFDAWTIWYGVQPQIFTSVDGTTYTSDVYVHTLSTTYTGDIIGTGSQVAIPMVWEPPPFRSSGAEVKARWNRIEYIFESPASEPVTIETWPDLNEGQRKQYTVTFEPDIVSSGTQSMLWTETASADPRRAWGTASTGPSWGGKSDSFSGDKRIPVIGLSELFSVRLINENISDFKLTALEVYRNDGGVR